MPYSPTIQFDNSGAAFNNAAGSLGFAIGAYAKKQNEKAKKANALRKIMSVYDPENKDRYTSMGYDDLEAEHQSQVVRRAEEARKLDIDYKRNQIATAQQAQALSRAQMDNLSNDNTRADKMLEFQKTMENRRVSENSRKDWMQWWDRTMQSKRQADRDAALAKPPTVVDLGGNPYAFQEGTGHIIPLMNRSELTAGQRARTAADLTGRIAQLSAQLDKLNTNDPSTKANWRMLSDEISITRRLRDQLADPAKPDPFGKSENGSANTESEPNQPTEVAPAPPPGDNATMARQAKQAIAQGANPALVKKKYKEMTGQDLVP